MDITERIVPTLTWLALMQSAQSVGVGIDLIYDAIASAGLKHTRLGHRTIRRKPE
mgnify:CR=1 FL=1